MPTRTSYRCTDCGSASTRWIGRCGTCGAWGTLTAEQVPARRSGDGVSEAPRTAAISLADVGPGAAVAVPTGVPELDRVLGGGLVPGSVTLLGGEPGIGKSTLLLQALGALAETGLRCLLVAGEESPHQVARRAVRLGLGEAPLDVVADTALPAVLAHVADRAPDVLAVDSVQVLADPDTSGLPGSVTQVRECAHQLVRAAKERAMSVVLVGHVTKDGTLAGPRTLEHLVDTVLAFDGDRHHTLRFLHALKHRFGPTQDLGVLEMTERGLVGVPDASALFLADRPDDGVGSVVAPVVHGARPVLVEVQGLVVPCRGGPPRRVAQGLDAARLAMILAILDQRARLALSGADVYASVAGALRVPDPALDLALAVALASAHLGRAVPRDLAVMGELGLGGEVRQVAQLERRVAEAARLGVRRVIVPTTVSAIASPQAALELVAVRSLREALHAALEASPRGARPDAGERHAVTLVS